MMPNSTPLSIQSGEAKRDEAQTSLVVLRTLSYSGVQLNALLFPFLVYQLSSSVSLAGLALLAEWIPKFGLYLIGGSLMQRFGQSNAHLMLEAGRLLAVAGLLACASGHGSLWLLAACSALYQCCNALSNILFENSVTRWWHVGGRSHGHARLLKADQIGCMLTLLAGIALKSPVVLAGAGFCTQGILLLGTWLKRRTLYPPTETAAPQPTPLARQIACDARAAAQGPLPGFALATVLMGVPAALMISALAYFLERAQAGSASNAQWLSAILLGRTALSLVVLYIVQNHLRKGGRDTEIAWIGAAVLAAGSFAMAAPSLSLLALGMNIALIGAAASLYMPLMRNVRQAIIVQYVGSSSRSGVSGILISVEAGAYLVAGALIWVFGSNLSAMALSAGAVALAGSVHLLWRHARVPVVADQNG